MRLKQRHAISIYLFVHTLKLLKESVTILMQMTPADLNVDEIKNRLIMQIDTLKDIHHIHVWNLTDNLIHFESHINLSSDLKVSETSGIFESVRKILHDEFDVEHVTIQFEFEHKKGEGCEC